MRARSEQEHPPTDLVAGPDGEERRDLLALYAWMLDSSIRLPGGFRIGLDGLLGLIPVVGDVLAALLSGGIVVHGIRSGASAPVVLRMLGNIVLELVVGAVPVVGDLFDFAFRANERNVRLLQRHTDQPRAMRRRSLAWVTLVGAGLLAVLAGIAILLWQLLALIISSVGAL